MTGTFTKKRVMYLDEGLLVYLSIGPVRYERQSSGRTKILINTFNYDVQAPQQQQ